MYKNNQLWNRFFPISQRISYWYKETPRCPNIYIIDLNKFLLLFLLTINKQKYFSSSPKLLFNYIIFEFTLLLVVRPWYSENYIATISCTWEWASIYQRCVVVKSLILKWNNKMKMFFSFIHLYILRWLKKLVTCLLNSL